MISHNAAARNVVCLFPLQMINQALLANRRAIGRLFVNLMEADLKREVVQRNKLEERIRVWRAVQKDATISNFRSGVFGREMFCVPDAIQREPLG